MMGNLRYYLEHFYLNISSLNRRVTPGSKIIVHRLHTYTVRFMRLRLPTNVHVFIRLITRLSTSLLKGNNVR